MLMFITDVHALGLKTAQGLNFTTAWYWGANDANRAFAKKFAAANGGKMPTMVQAGVYSSVIHYLKAVEALKSDADGAKVVAEMKRSEEHTSELQSLMRISYAVFCLKQKTNTYQPPLQS